MNCVEAEQLFDAHLDGELGGTLRLEFDAHRLRCGMCQQKLAMLEACEHMLAADSRTPGLRDDFVDRVMGAVATVQPLPAPRRRLQQRWVIGVTALGAAAGVALSFIWPGGSGVPGASPGAAATAVISPDLANAMDDESGVELYRYILSRVDQLSAAPGTLARDVRKLPGYAFDMALPADGRDLMPANPLFWFLGLWNHDSSIEPDSPEAGERFSL